MKLKPSFVVYVDESGDEGFAFKGPRFGSSHWFVLSAVVTRKHLDLATVKLVDEVRQQLGYRPRKAMHFSKMKHEHRLPYIQHIATATAKIRTVTVLVHKPSITEAEKFMERNRLYYYTTRLLLERVSWLCRDNRRASDPGDGSAEVIFSNRSGTSYPEMKVYFELLQQRSKLDDVRIDWNVVKTDQVQAINHEARMGLQIADAVASSFYYGVQPSQHGFNEPRYAQMLKAVVYYHKKRALGYGLKFWPREAMALVGKETDLKWVRECYQ